MKAPFKARQKRTKQSEILLTKEEKQQQKEVNTRYIYSQSTNGMMHSRFCSSSGQLCALRLEVGWGRWSRSRDAEIKYSFESSGEGISALVHHNYDKIPVQSVKITKIYAKRAISPWLSTYYVRCNIASGYSRFTAEMVLIRFNVPNTYLNYAHWIIVISGVSMFISEWAKRLTTATVRTYVSSNGCK